MERELTCRIRCDHFAFSCNEFVACVGLSSCSINNPLGRMCVRVIVSMCVFPLHLIYYSHKHGFVGR